MVTLLAGIFIKNKEEYTNPVVRRLYGIMCSIIGIAFNILLFAGKYFAGMVSGSVAITADAFNNLSDAGSSIITLVGFKFSGMKPDTEHPFGHGRFEYISGFVVSMAIIMMGFELAKTSVSKIIHPEEVETGVLAATILLVSIAVKIYMAYYNRRIAKKIDSSAMRATSTDSLSDSIATTVVLLTMGISKLTGVNLDGISGLLVALFILYAGLNAAKETISPLLGQAAEPEFVKSIEDIIASYDDIIGVHDLIVHDYGPGRVMISLHAEVSGDGDIFELHDAIDRAELQLKKELGCEATIHMDPIAVNDVEGIEKKEILVDNLKKIDKRLTLHDFRMVKGPTHTNLIFDIVVPYKFEYSDDEIIKKIDEVVDNNWKNHYAVIKIDRSYVTIEDNK